MPRLPIRFRIRGLIAGLLVGCVYRLRRLLRIWHDALAPAELVVTEQATAFWRSAALLTVANLRIADFLAGTEKSLNELAELTGTKPELLERLLHAVRALGFFRQVSHRVYANNTKSYGLCVAKSHGKPSLGHALEFQFKVQWEHWGVLDKVVKVGQTSFQALSTSSVVNSRNKVEEGELNSQYIRNDVNSEVLGSGLTLFHKFKVEPVAAEMFHRAMQSVTSLATAELLLSYPWHAHKSVIDVGGGLGSFLRDLHNFCPEVKKTVFDLPSTFCSLGSDARSALPFEIVEGSFFELSDFLKSYDLLILKHILHDWSDDKCHAILQGLRSNMSQNSTLLIVETLYDESGNDLVATFADLEMMHSFQSRERTLDMFRQLLQVNRLQMVTLIRTFSPFVILVCKPSP